MNEKLTLRSVTRLTKRSTTKTVITLFKRTAGSANDIVFCNFLVKALLEKS